MDSSIFIEERLADLSDFIEQEKILDSVNSVDDCTIDVLNKHSLLSLKNAYTPLFLRMIKEEQFEVGYPNKLDELVSDLLQRNSMVTANWLSDLYINNFSSNQVQLAILFVISRIEDKTILNVLRIIALASLSNKDIEIRETAIRCFENWGGFDSYDCLKSTTVDSVEWLENYKKDVVKDIEKSLNSK